MRETVEIRTGTVKKFVVAIAIAVMAFSGYRIYAFERGFAADYARLSHEHDLVLQFLAAPVAHVGEQALSRAAVLEAVANERLAALQAEVKAEQAKAAVTKAAEKGK